MGKQVTELDVLPSFTDNSLLPVHNGAGLKKGLLSQLASFLGTKFSNPNLLINPDFKINQRGATSYEKQGYSVDRWKIWNVTVTPSESGGITVKNDKYEDIGTFIQILESATEGDSTLSCYVESVSGTVTMVADDNSQVILKQGLNIVHTSRSTKNFTIFLNQGTSVTLKWVKLEQGKVATPFVAPNYADELVKCQRYFMHLPSSMVGYGFNNVIYAYIENLDKMRTDGTIGITGNNDDTNLLSGGNFLQKLKVNVSATSVNHAKKFAKVTFDAITSSYNNTTMGIDMNSTKIYVDAEIY